MTGPNAEIYRNLWNMNSLFQKPPPNKPVAIAYQSFARMPDGQAAFFATHEGDRPFPHIRIGRHPVPAECWKADLEGATVLELVSLTHERGHEQSWRDGTYKPNTMPEEFRAWSHAEVMLRALGFNDWLAFEDAKRGSLDEHRRRGTPAD